MSLDQDPWLAAAAVASALDDLGVRYAIAGSLASGVVGEPRYTADVDMVVDLRESHIEPLIERLSPRFYIPTELLRRAARARTSANLIDNETGLKVDLFVAGGTPLDADTLARRVATTSEGVETALYVLSAEDVILHKLRWYRRGGETSDRQWRDVVGVVRLQAGLLDRAYLAYGAGLLGVTDLLERALAQQ
jgi:hypothetical protein